MRDAILQAAAEAGGNAGLVGYLKAQATKNPGPFLALLGKVLPTQIASDGAIPVTVTGIDRPPPETREEWLARRAREAPQQGGGDGAA